MFRGGIACSLAEERKMCGPRPSALRPLLYLGVGYRMPADIRVVVFGKRLIYPLRSICMECKTRLCRLDVATQRDGVRRLNRGSRTPALPRKQRPHTIAAAAAPSRGQPGGCQANAWESALGTTC